MASNINKLEKVIRLINSELETAPANPEYHGPEYYNLDDEISGSITDLAKQLVVAVKEDLDKLSEEKKALKIKNMIQADEIKKLKLEIKKA